MGKLFDKIGQAAVTAAGIAGAAANAGGLIPSSNDRKSSSIPTKEERSLASIQEREKKEAIKKANKGR